MLTPEDLQRLREFIRKQPDATLEECRAHLGASCSTMTVSRALSQLGRPRKKKVPRAQEQDRPDVQEQRREFCNDENSARSWPAWTGAGWSSSTSAGPTRR